MGPEVWVLRSGLGRRAPEGFAISCSTSAFLFGNYAPRMPVRTVLLQNIDKPSGIIGALCHRSPNLFASGLQLASAGCAKRLQLKQGTPQKSRLSENTKCMREGHSKAARPRCRIAWHHVEAQVPEQDLPDEREDHPVSDDEGQEVHKHREGRLSAGRRSRR